MRAVFLQRSLTAIREDLRGKCCPEAERRFVTLSRVLSSMVPEPRRSEGTDAAFVTAHHAAGAAAALGSVLYTVVVGWPGLAEAVALLWLGSFAGVGWLARQPGRMDLARIVSMGSFGAFVAYLSILTGGLGSPFLFFLLVLPVDAALSRSGRLMVIGTGAAAGGVALTGAASLLGLVPDPFVAPGAIEALRAAAALSAALYLGAGVIAIARAERAAEAEARRSDLIFRTLGESASDVILRLSAKGEVRFASPAARDVFGVPPEGMEGRPVFAFVHGEDQTALLKGFDAAALSKCVSAAEVRCLTAYGLRWIEFRLKPVADGAWGAAEDAPDFVAIARDTTLRRVNEIELEKARDLAEASSRSKSRFLANMSHELRTPLNAVIGFSDVMRQEMFGPVGLPKYKEYASLIHDSGRHLLDLINDILDTSKIEAGKYELTYAPVDVRELIARTLEVVRVQAERKKVKLTASAGAAPGFVADGRALKQILLNLLSNAIKFTPAGGTVEVASAMRAGWVCVGVSDDGVGIPADDVARLGRPFEQAATAYTRNHEGTGLGLSLVKAFAELHGGHMEIESALGEGTIVRVYVPLSPAHAERLAAE
jgi:cell cycle sensor histidine kinase DivJ